MRKFFGQDICIFQQKQIKEETNMKVPFTKYAQFYKKYAKELRPAILNVLKSGRLILQQEGEDFERHMAEYLKVKHFLGVSDGTDALQIALRAAGIGPGDEVITVSHTFVATIQVIAHLGATPILVDIGDDYLMDVEKIEAAITPKTKAIIPVHLSGDVCNMARISEIAAERNLIVIEDAAQALGAEWAGRKAGGFGLAGCFSFYPAKILGAFGDGGGIATNDDRMAEEIKKLRNHYMIGKRPVSEEEVFKFGYNSRLDNVWAKVLDIKLTHLPEDIQIRKEIAQIYDQELRGIQGLFLPSDHGGRIYQDYVIRTEKQRELVDFLARNGVGTLGIDLIPNHKHKGLGLEHFSLPKTEKYTYEFIRLPCNQFMNLREARYVAKMIRKFYAKI